MSEWRHGRLRRAFELPLVVVAALLFLFEEFLWAWLEALFAVLARLRAVAWLEVRIARLPPYPAMALFLVPVLFLLPAHLAALYLAARGRFAAAVGVYVAVKLVGTAVLARLFVLCRPSLLSLAWFARLCRWVVRTKTWLYAQLDAVPAWRSVRDAALRLRSRLGRGSLRARTEAIRRRWRGA